MWQMCLAEALLLGGGGGGNGQVVEESVLMLFGGGSDIFVTNMSTILTSFSFYFT